jgi:hypothetical protein
MNKVAEELLRISELLVGEVNNKKELLDKYPIRNKAWSFNKYKYDGRTPEFIAEDSESRGIDPWGRKLPKPNDVIKDEEDETTEYVYLTTVDGFKVRLRVFND